MVCEARLVSTQADALRSRPAIKVELEPDPTAPGRARHELRRFQDQLSAGVLARTELLLSELVTNSVLHAGLGDGDRIGVFVSLAPEMIHVEVGDAGPGFEPPPAPGLDDVRGRGLMLVDTVSDRWGMRRAGSVRVWFEIDCA